MSLKFDNIEIDQDRIATDQMVYLIKIMKLAKKSGIKKGYSKAKDELEGEIFRLKENIELLENKNKESHSANVWEQIGYNKSKKEFKKKIDELKFTGEEMKTDTEEDIMEKERIMDEEIEADDMC